MSRVFANWNKKRNQQTTSIKSCNTDRLKCINIPINQNTNKTHDESRNDTDECNTSNESSKRTVSTQM